MKKVIHVLSIICFCLFTGNVFATIIVKVPKACSVCGHTEEQYEYLSYNNFGSKRYLDLRVRGGMMPTHFIQVCDECGLVSYDITKPVCKKQSEIVKSKEYKKIIGEEYSYSDAYMAHAFLLEKCNSDSNKIAKSVLQAAWSADDKKDSVAAIKYRKKAIPYYEKSESLEDQIVLVDLYRRTKDWTKAKLLADQISNKDLECIMQEIIKQQKKLIENKDEKNHEINSELCKVSSK